MKWLLLALALASCGTDDLSADVVTHLPDGDGAGNGASGSYAVDLYVRSCEGKCTYHYAGTTQSVCDVGQRRSSTLMVTQQNGHLRLEPVGSDLVLTRLDGGIWKSGRFDVGGVATQLGGAVVITARATGTLDPTRQLGGQARAHAAGAVQGDSLDCIATFDFSGAP